MPMSMRVAAIQLCSGTGPRANLEPAAAALREAASRGAALAVLPENFACYAGDYRAVAERDGEMLRQWASQQARALGLWLVAGTLPLVQRPDGSAVPAPRVRAASLLFAPDGSEQARYDKLHLFDADVADAQGRYRESGHFEPGDRLRVARAGELSVGMAVCYDLRFAALARVLAERGAHLLVYPSAFTAVTGAAHWELLLRARAVESGCYVLGAGQCGAHDARRHSHGHSMLVDPWGTVVASLGETPGVLVEDLDLARLEEIRHRLPVHQHHRLITGLPDDITDN